MTPVWSPEAIDDLVSLRTYIEQDSGPPRNVSRFTSSTTLKHSWLRTRKWVGQVASRARANS